MIGWNSKVLNQIFLGSSMQSKSNNKLAFKVYLLLTYTINCTVNVNEKYKIHLENYADISKIDFGRS